VGAFASVHALVPLQERSTQGESSQEMVVPEQIPPPQVSPYVQRLPSLQTAESLHCHVPPAFVQKYEAPPHETTSHEWVASHVELVPLPQTPLALLTPQPMQLRPVVRVVVPQTSAPPQSPAAVEQPDTALHWATQHWLVGPTSQAVLLAAHAQALQAPPPSQ
jgi:hypothetical protein